CSLIFCSETVLSLLQGLYEDHAVSCAGIVGIKHRHNVVRDTLVDICYRSGISYGNEVDNYYNSRSLATAIFSWKSVANSSFSRKSVANSSFPTDL
ncbi:hypothetical protein Tco_0263428, partial [Tanacetum coccineum]